ncbi:hypothetical protein AJ80_09034 [Polytolypa hystricis UAMH7299]|uniref:Uncharacterized protein n=1 Tax=Polytolypa hystricis (strain UAMH7299) TaxID=1447883 RepID=A0A2B7WXE3_POLH7|nr:hypothetical protein AJ80_09034 [Polytolypa hystricis UAMH7299]
MNHAPNLQPPRSGDIKPIHYTPPASVAREIALMFGFIGLCVLTMVVYWLFWQANQRRNAIKETSRLEAFNARIRESEKQAAQAQAQAKLATRSKTRSGSGDSSEDVFVHDEVNVELVVAGSRSSSTTTTTTAQSSPRRGGRNGTSTAVVGDMYGLAEMERELIV